MVPNQTGARSEIRPEPASRTITGLVLNQAGKPGLIQSGEAKGGYLSDGYVVLLPQTDEVNRASAGIEKDGVYALFSAKKAVACDARPMPETEGFLASLYEEKVKPYRGKNGHPVEWTPRLWRWFWADR